jgi:hypothetical protein
MNGFLVISIALAIGCRDEGLARLESVRDKVCACPTPESGETAIKGVPETGVKSTARSQKIARDMMDCLAKLYGKNRPETGPDAETTDAP